jgi:hypothetical protein
VKLLIIRDALKVCSSVDVVVCSNERACCEVKVLGRCFDLGLLFFFFGERVERTGVGFKL